MESLSFLLNESFDFRDATAMARGSILDLSGRPVIGGDLFFYGCHAYSSLARWVNYTDDGNIKNAGPLRDVGEKWPVIFKLCGSQLNTYLMLIEAESKSGILVCYDHTGLPFNENGEGIRDLISSGTFEAKAARVICYFRKPNKVTQEFFESPTYALQMYKFFAAVAVIHCINAVILSKQNHNWEEAISQALQADRFATGLRPVEEMVIAQRLDTKIAKKVASKHANDSKDQVKFKDWVTQKWQGYEQLGKNKTEAAKLIAGHSELKAKFPEVRKTADAIRHMLKPSRLKNQ